MYIEDTLNAILNELKTLNAAFAHIGAATRTPAEPQKASAPATAESQKAPAAKAAEPQKAPAAKAAEVQKEPAAKAALSYDDDVLPVAKRYLARHGRDKLAELLRTYGVQNARQLSQDQLGAFVRSMEEAL